MNTAETFLGHLPTYEKLFQCGNERAIILYLRYSMNACHQNTHKPWCNNKYMYGPEGLGWGKNQFYEAKKILIDLGLIESKTDMETHKTYITVNNLERFVKPSETTYDNCDISDGIPQIEEYPQNEDRGVVPNLKTISKTVIGGSPQFEDTKCLVNKNKCLVNNAYISKEIGKLDISPSVDGGDEIDSQLVDISVYTQEPTPETADIPTSYKLGTIDMVLDIFKKVFKKHGLVVDTESKEARKYASHYVTTRGEKKGQLSEKRMGIIKGLGYEGIEDFVDDILTRADTLQYGNRKAKLSSIYGVWKHKEEILNQTAAKEGEHGSRENFKWYLANIVGKQSFIDVAGNKITYAPVNYSNFLVNTYGFTPVDAGEIRDEMYEWYNSKLK